MVKHVSKLSVLLFLTALLGACDSGGSTDSEVSNTPSPSTFDIQLRFLDPFSSAQKAAVRDALTPWTDAITENLAPASVSSSQIPADCVIEQADIDDVLLLVQKGDLDGQDGTLARAKPCVARTDSQGKLTTVAMGIIEIDKADLDNNALDQIVTHEVGHALGIGAAKIEGWDSNLSALNTLAPFHNGANTTDAFQKLGGSAHLNTGVPLENTGGQGTARAHWREVNFDNELMTGFLNGGRTNPLSRVSLAALQDIGYSVDLNAADAYTLPMPQVALQRAEADATLSTPNASGANFGTPDDGKRGDAVVIGNNNAQRWSSSDPEDEVFTGLLRFDVPSSLPSGVSVQNAKIELVVKDTNNETTMHDIKIFEVTESWAEEQVTGSSAPTSNSSAETVFDFESRDGKTKCFRPQSDQCKDLTSLTTDWVSGRTSNHGITLKAPDASSHPLAAFSVGYYSRHADSPLRRPILVIRATNNPSALTAKSGSSGKKIPLGDDIRKGTIHGLDANGKVVRTKHLR